MKYPAKIEINIPLPVSKCDTIGKHYATFLRGGEKWYKK
jgi:hypothetical protein